MKSFLYDCVGIVAKIHDKIMSLNNAYETNFTDKDLHFLIIGILGLCMLLVIYPLFKYLAKKNLEMVIAWIYVFTVVVVITFAIEIGQKITKTGNMEFADIMYGLVGFMAMFAGFIALRLLYRGGKMLIKYLQKQQELKAATLALLQAQQEQAQQEQPQQEQPVQEQPVQEQ
jgi:hypothetical protein